MTGLKQYPDRIFQAKVAVDDGWNVFFRAEEACKLKGAQIDGSAIGNNEKERKKAAEEEKSGEEYQALHRAMVSAKRSVNMRQFELDRLKDEFKVALVLAQQNEEWDSVEEEAEALQEETA